MYFVLFLGVQLALLYNLSKDIIRSNMYLYVVARMMVLFWRAFWSSGSVVSRFGFDHRAKNVLS